MVGLLDKVAQRCRRLSLGWKIAAHPENYSIYPKAIFDFHQLSFSQEGEDRILQTIFGQKATGFFVDVGAFHPQRFSNTYLFYMKGWRGINIDARPGSMDTFARIRSQDINLEFAVSDTCQKLIYHQFLEPALNTFSREMSQKLQANQQPMVAEKELVTRTLAEILDQYLPPGQAIDFFSIDVEGLDLQVLQSNNWAKYRPRVVLAEDPDRTCLAKMMDSRLARFMQDQGYQLLAKGMRSIFFGLQN